MVQYGGPPRPRGGCTQGFPSQKTQDNRNLPKDTPPIALQYAFLSILGRFGTFENFRFFHEKSHLGGLLPNDPPEAWGLGVAMGTPRGEDGLAKF